MEEGKLCSGHVVVLTVEERRECNERSGCKPPFPHQSPELETGLVTENDQVVIRIDCQQSVVERCNTAVSNHGRACHRYG